MDRDEWRTDIDVKIERDAKIESDIRDYSKYGSCQIKRNIYLIGGQKCKSNTVSMANKRILRYDCELRQYFSMEIKCPQFLLNPVVIRLEAKNVIIIGGVSFLRGTPN